MSVDPVSVSNLKAEILSRLKGSRSLTFANFEALPGARGCSEISRELPYSNTTVVIWKAVSDELISALLELEEEQRVSAVVTSAQHYFQTGDGLRLEEISPEKLTFKTKRRRAYWQPIAFKPYAHAADWERVRLSQLTPTQRAKRS
jgi:hypothetical protein